MMMPANYSVIAENEMTYVTGGGVIANVLPAVMTEANWKNVTTNIVKIVGNAFLQPVVDATLGVMFGGSWLDGKSMFGETSGTISTYYTGSKTVLNKIMGTIGGLAAVYTLGTDAVKMTAPTLKLN